MYTNATTTHVFHFLAKMCWILILFCNTIILNIDKIIFNTSYKQNQFWKCWKCKKSWTWVTLKCQGAFWIWNFVHTKSVNQENIWKNNFSLWWLQPKSPLHLHWYWNFVHNPEIKVENCIISSLQTWHPNWDWPINVLLIKNPQF